MEKDIHLAGWQAAERFSFKAAYLQLEINKLTKEVNELKVLIENLKAENQRLQQIAQY